MDWIWMASRITGAFMRYNVEIGEVGGEIETIG